MVTLSSGPKRHIVGAQLVGERFSEVDRKRRHPAIGALTPFQQGVVKESVIAGTLGLR